MSDRPAGSFDPYEEMRAFYRLDNPTEEQQFRFVEAMKFLIDNSYFESDIIASCYNLAMYYRDIKEFALERKYLEIGEKYGSDVCKEDLGFLWYYGPDGKQDYEKAYRYFSECDTPRTQYMIADMYHDGSYVRRDIKKCRKIIDGLFERMESERQDPRFVISTLFPEIALRYVKLNIEEQKYTSDDDGIDDIMHLFDAREILTIRQQRRPFWGNLRLMRRIIETLDEFGRNYFFVDLYDLMTSDADDAWIFSIMAKMFIL